MNYSEKVIIALDVQSQEKLDFLIEELKDVAQFVKVGMELFYTFGPQVIQKLKSHGFKVFLDLKIHDIPNTAKKSCKTITKLGADIINVHIAGGEAMLRASVEGVNEALSENSDLARPLLIGVTQLTSTDQSMLENDLLIQGEIDSVVAHYASVAYKSGLDGVVSSPLEVKLVKEVTSKNFLCITPGIRPRTTENEDQKRVTTPNEAFDNGSDFIVIGRAITNSQSPRKAFINILNNLGKE